MNSARIVDVSVQTSDDLTAHPVEDQRYWTVTEGDRPTYTSRSDFVSADERLHVGVSQYDKMTLRLTDYPVDEFMHILEGQVEITDENGASKVYGPGDKFVMPKGFSGTWRQLSAIKKLDVYYGTLA